MSFLSFVVVLVGFCRVWTCSSFLGPAAFILAVRVLLSWWLGGQVRGLFDGVILVCFWLIRRPSTLFGFFPFELIRIVLPLTLDISFG